MQQDWIEFELVNDKGDRTYMSFRPENITAILFDDKEKTQIAYDIGATSKDFFTVLGSYEQVKQKIIDAEKLEVSYYKDCFTRDEYRTTLELVKDKLLDLGSQPREDVLAELENIRDKLNEILKEDK